MAESRRYEHLDRLKRADLGQWQGAADALDDWLMRVHGTTSGLHNLGLLLDLLADAGYVVLNPAEIRDAADGVPPVRLVLGEDMPIVIPGREGHRG